jgi:multidrug efflux system membrane fusion protein
LSGRLAAAAVALMTAAACTQGGNGQGAAPAGAGGGGRGRAGGEGGPVPVVTTTVVERPIVVAVAGVGTVEPISAVQVRAQVSGRLMQVHFAEGQEVRAGQPLFSLDPQPFQVALDQASAVLARDTAQADNAQAQLTRLKNLLDRGLLPRDQYETQLANANALTATIAADRAGVAAARLNLDYATINAPVSGRTGSLSAYTGDLVQAGSASPLVVINQLAPIYVTFSVPGKDLDQIRKFQRRTPLVVEARLSGAESEEATATGRLTFVDNAVDAQTGTIKLKGTFTNTGHDLWPGQYVDVRLVLTTEPKALVVPSVAVQAGQAGPFVFIVDEQKHATTRPVSVARTEGDLSVIASGLSAGDVVITDGQLRVTPNAVVAPRAPIGAEAAATSGATSGASAGGSR